MIIEKQTIKNKTELQTKIQKIQSSKIIVYEDTNKKEMEQIIKELATSSFTIILLGKEKALKKNIIRAD